MDEDRLLVETDGLVRDVYVLVDHHRRLVATIHRDELAIYIAGSAIYVNLVEAVRIGQARQRAEAAYEAGTATCESEERERPGLSLHAEE